MATLRNGTSGPEVKALQEKLGQLGFKLVADGEFGKATEGAVIQLQKLFGYTVDGVVGDGTKALIDAQIGYGWNVNAPDAAAKASGAAAAGAAKATK